VDPALFLADLEAKPDHLGHLADVLDGQDPWSCIAVDQRRILFLGMGSSHYASSVAAARLRSRGVDAVAELASSDLLPPPDAATTVVAVSAGGESPETRSAVDRYRGRCQVVLLTNTPDRAPEWAVDERVEMLAGEERGGVACRSFQHTLVLLLGLEQRLVPVSGRSLPGLLRAAADASANLLGRRAEWLPPVVEALRGPHGVHVAAPARRLSSALQSALMLREGPRVPAVGCETGDWNHVEVYLTRTTDYRLLLLAGSPYEAELLRWTTERGSTVVAVGADVDGAPLSLRYVGDTDDDVRLLTETLVAELVAAKLWSG
jgi:fructoselysine-6-P-deglycase FrlB-like protein